MNMPKSPLRSFVESLQGKGYDNAILLAERESMNARRKAMRSCRKDPLQATDWCDYSRKLADLIRVLRCESTPMRVDPDTRRLILSVKEGFAKRAV